MTAKLVKLNQTLQLGYYHRIIDSCQHFTALCIKERHWMTYLYFQLHINIYYNFLLFLLVIKVSSLKYKQKVVFKGLTSYQVDKIMLAAHSPTLHKTIYRAKISIILFILLLCF